LTTDNASTSPFVWETSGKRVRTRRLLSLIALAALLALTVGCRQDMYNQPRYKPYAASSFWPNGSSARPIPKGTVARSQLRANRVYYTGMTPDGNFVADLPVPITRKLLKRGQQRFDIFCTPCHGRLGDGNGMIPSRGFKHPPSYHIPRLRSVPIGYFYDVITHGFGQMSSYATQVPPSDRWAIAAYIRVLQLSQGAHLSDLPPAEQAKFKAAMAKQSDQHKTPANQAKPAADR